MEPILLITADRSVTFTATVVIAGITIVLAVLLLLILVFYLFGAIVSRAGASSQKKAQKKAQKDQPAPIPPVQSKPEPVQTETAQTQPAAGQGISGEVVAAISAAVVAYDGPNAVVKSIKNKNAGTRNPWAAAAVADNTRPF